jgi:hypothetical protein
VEGEAVALEALHAREVAVAPLGWEVLERPLLVGEEEDDVHTVEVA